MHGLWGRDPKFYRAVTIPKHAGHRNIVYCSFGHTSFLYSTPQSPSPRPLIVLESVARDDQHTYTLAQQLHPSNKQSLHSALPSADCFRSCVLWPYSRHHLVSVNTPSRSLPHIKKQLTERPCPGSSIPNINARLPAHLSELALPALYRPHI